MKLNIEKAVYGGSSLARISEGELLGKTVFVPLTLPGELVEAHIVEDKRGFINAEADSILETSPHRTTPTCPYFGGCGGCSYQHADYTHQVEMKVGILREALQRAHFNDLPAIKAVSGEAWNYRNRIRLRAQATPFSLAYRERRSNKLLAVDKCPIAAPLLEKAFAIVTEQGALLRLAEVCDEIEFFAADELSLLLSLYREGRDKPPPAKLVVVCNALSRQIPELRGVGLFVVHDRQLARLVQTWGEGSLIYKAAGSDYRVSSGSFFQVNRFLVNTLVDLVTGGRKGRLAWDLYAGVGLFARALADAFERVIAVESSSASSADLRHNLKGTSHRVVKASTLDFLQEQKHSATPPDLIVIDPPRAGLGTAITSLLAQIGPAEIIYVSCDPATLSRDLVVLVQSGYNLRTITMVDMFPQTFHLESVSVLTRR